MSLFIKTIFCSFLLYVVYKLIQVRISPSVEWMNLFQNFYLGCIAFLTVRYRLVWFILMFYFRHLILDNLEKLVVFSIATIHLIQILLFLLHSTNSKEHKQEESMI